MMAMKQAINGMRANRVLPMLKFLVIRLAVNCHPDSAPDGSTAWKGRKM
jgi:hypothetical protein